MKRKFITFLIKRWTVLLAIAVIIGIVLTTIIEQYYLEEELQASATFSAGNWEKNVDMEVISGISMDVTEEEKEASINKAIFFLSIRKNNGALIRRDTGEHILPQEDVVIICPDLLKTFYSCPMSYFDEFDWKNTECGYYLSSYYYIGNKFLPGFLETEWPKILPEKFETLDLTPQDTEGYSYVDNASVNLFSYYEAPYYSQDILTENLDPNLKEFNATGSNSVYYEETKGFMQYKCYEYTYRAVGEEVFSLIYVYDLDLWSLYYESFIPIYIGLLVGSILIAVIIALLDFKRYEKFEYQRKLTSSLAHDLKSPLTVVSGYVENLEANLFPEKRDLYIQGIEENVRYMNDIITNILELSRLQEKKDSLQKAQVNLGGMCNAIITKYKSEIEKKDLTFRLLGDVTIECNKISMERVFDNLINNAIAYTPQGEVVEISIDNKGIVFKNPYNVPIACKTKELVEPFAKGDISRGNHGTGLGLSIVNTIADLHRFRLEITDSDNVFMVKIKY